MLGQLRRPSALECRAIICPGPGDGGSPEAGSVDPGGANALASEPFLAALAASVDWPLFLTWTMNRTPIRQAPAAREKGAGALPVRSLAV